MSEQLIARVSKGRTLFLLLIAAGFVAVGIWFVGNAEAIAASSRRALLADPMRVRIFGWVAILFFGGGGVIIARHSSAPSR